MNKTVSIWLLTLFFALLPAIGRAQGDCVTKFKAETDPLTEQFKELDKQSADLSKREDRVFIRNFFASLMATSIPPLVATKNCPTPAESYRGMKKERSFVLKALWTSQSA
jgi:hypothetical protein